jgi:adenosylcobinamide hydrolase
MGYDFAGTTTDEVVVLYDKNTDKNSGAVVHEYAGTLTDCGSRVYTCVKNGISEAIKRHEEIIPVTKPSFFIFSTRDGLKMTLWQKKGCQYYPCHFKGQRCELCYCPFYPCEDTSLGEWFSSPENKVWSCKRCLLNHYPEIVRQIQKNPEINLEELKNTAIRLNLKLTG